MKRILSFAISLALLLTSFSVSSYANSADDLYLTGKADVKAEVQRMLGNEASASDVATAVAEVTFLDKYNMEKEILSKVHKNKDNSLTYSYNLPNNVVSQITPQKTADGQVLKILEGDLYNEVMFKKNGEVYLNGKRVIADITTTEVPASIDNQTAQNVVIQPLMIEEYYTTACPYGSSSNYSVLNRTVVNANVAFSNAWLSITVGAFATIMGVLCPALTFSSALIASCITLFQSSNPTSSSASFKDYIYRHTSGYFVTQILAVEKHKSVLWPLANYQGNSTTKYSYFNHKIGV